MERSALRDDILTIGVLATIVAFNHLPSAIQPLSRGGLRIVTNSLGIMLMLWVAVSVVRFVRGDKVSAVHLLIWLCSCAFGVLAVLHALFGGAA
jgi:uncharacterized membrane protein